MTPRSHVMLHYDEVTARPCDVERVNGAGRLLRQQIGSMSHA